jgi:hypothetical protein
MTEKWRRLVGKRKIGDNLIEIPKSDVRGKSYLSGDIRLPLLGRDPGLRRA